MQDKFEYTFTYTHDGTTLTMTFPATITIDDLSDKIYEFLCGCGWDRDCLKHIAKGCNLYYEEDGDDCTGSGE